MSHLSKTFLLDPRFKVVILPDTSLGLLGRLHWNLDSIFITQFVMKKKMLVLNKLTVSKTDLYIVVCAE